MKSKLQFMAQAARQAITRKPISRGTEEVVDEYRTSWNSFRQKLEAATALEEWLNIPGFDSSETWFNVDSRLFYGLYNASAFYRAELKRAFDNHFSNVGSITEYGSGLGRNLLFLKSRIPSLKCYGYELTQEGVDIARSAAEKFGLDVQYSQLDYLNDPPAKFIFPATDVACTVFSLEQLPSGCDHALTNILEHTRRGSIHLEPVTELYPYTLRGLLARIDHKKAGYLRGFPKALKSQTLSSVWRETMTSSHNPFMFPSIYALKKPMHDRDE